MDINRFKMAFARRVWLFRKAGFSKRGKKCYIGKPLFFRGKNFFTFGNDVTLYKNARIECFSDYEGQKLSPNFIVGDGCCIGYNFQCLVTTDCIIGDNTLIASNVLITTENHGINPETLYVHQPLSSKKVVIGKNCWIGERCIILPGVEVGDNAIIGAGSVVTKSIPANSMAVGSPAKVIKKYNFDLRKWEDEIR